MKIKELFYTYNGIARGIIESDSGNEYCTSLDPDLFRSWCSCPFFVFKNEHCKHIKYLVQKVDYGKMVGRKLNYLETGCETIDDMLGGGVPFGIVTAVFGEPTSGKTLFGDQMGLANIAKTGKNTILIETEGLRSYDTKLVLYKFMSFVNF